MSTETVQRAAEAATKVAELQKEREDLLKGAKALEDQARENRKRAEQCKEEVQQWTTALNAHRTQHQVETATAAAAKAQAEAEGHAADLKRLKEEAAAELEKLKAANAAALVVGPPTA